MQHSTAEVEHELLQLWSSVEKDRDAAAARREAHAQRQRRRSEATVTKLAPIRSSPVGLGSSRAGAGSSGDGKGSWQRLWPAEEEAEEGRGAAADYAPTGPAIDAVAAEAAAAAQAGRTGESAAALERRNLLPGGSGSDQVLPGSLVTVPPHLPRVRTSSAASLQLLEQQQEGQQGQQAQQQQQQRAQHEVELQAASSAQRAAAWLRSIAAAPRDLEAAAAGEDEQEEAGEDAYLAGEWGAGSRTASQQLERLASGLRQQRSLNGQQLGRLAEEGSGGGQQQAAAAGGGSARSQDGSVGAAAAGGKEPSFWATLREMLLDIRLVAAGPERQALQVGVWARGWELWHSMGGLTTPCASVASLPMTDGLHIPTTPAHVCCHGADGAVAGLLQPGLCLHLNYQLRPRGAPLLINGGPTCLHAMPLARQNEPMCCPHALHMLSDWTHAATASHGRRCWSGQAWRAALRPRCSHRRWAAAR